jgi:hypothetical protein
MKILIKLWIGIHSFKYRKIDIQNITQLCAIDTKRKHYNRWKLCINYKYMFMHGVDFGKC